jgi:hypothetical protein
MSSDENALIRFATRESKDSARFLSKVTSKINNVVDCLREINNPMPEPQPRRKFHPRCGESGRYAVKDWRGLD